MGSVILPHNYLVHFICSFLLFIHSSVPRTARHRPPIVQRTTLQSITIITRKENIKEEEQRNWTVPPAASTLHPPSALISSPPVSSPVSPQAPPSLLATLLARKRPVITVPATTEISPPPRGCSRSSPERLPYLPQSPFHLFSYDLDEEPSPPAPACEETNKTTPPRSDGGKSSTSSFQLFHDASSTFPSGFYSAAFCSSPAPI